MKAFLALLISCLLTACIHSQWIFAGFVSGTGSNYPSVSVADENVVWFSGGTGGVPALWRSTNNGGTITPVNPPPCFEITCLFAKSANECFVGDGGSTGAAGGNAKLFRTTNAGVNWTQVNQTGGNSGFFLDIVFSKVNPLDGVAFSHPPAGIGQAYYLLKTIDGGVNWTVENPSGVTGSMGVWHCVIIYDASAYGLGITGGFFPRVYGTTDAGASWATFPILIAGNPLTSFAYSQVNTIALASTSSVVARTTDQGLTWQTVNSGGALCLRWIPASNTCYFMSSGIIKKSMDEGATWSSMTIAGGISGLKHFDFARTGITVYGFGIAADGSVIKLTEILTAINTGGENVPDRFKLYQNFPNPFNPSTSIKFDVPRQSQTKIIISDVLGRESAVLVNEQLAPGTYEVQWDASHFSSGVYYYKLESVETTSNAIFTDSKRMVLIK